MRTEAALMRTLLGELVRMLGRAAGPDGPGGAAVLSFMGLIKDQVRAVESVVNSCAAIEAKKVDQSLDAAKLVLLLSNLREDLRRSVRDAGFKGAVPFVDAAFDRAKWTGALNEDLVKEALSAPASFDVAFRPIERDATGRVREHARAFDDAESALAQGGSPDAIVRSRQDAPTLQSIPVSQQHDRFERDKLQAELAKANEMLDADIAEAAESGNPLPGVSEDRRSKLNRLDELKSENE